VRQFESLRILGIRLDLAPCDRAPMSAQANLVAVAGEVRSAELDASLSAMAFACELESMAAGAARTRLFQLASRIGLSADATRTVLDQYELRAKLLHEAHLVLRNLIVQPADAA
jgi:hypothetical protein